MPGPRFAQVFLTLGFLSMIASASLIQTVCELAGGERPGALEIFDRLPTAANLHAYERSLEDASLVASRLRPWMQLAEFEILADPGEKAVLGRGGWLFYRPGLLSVTGRRSAPPGGDRTHDPYPAIKSWHDELYARGIQLLVVPVPSKESIYPELLARRADGMGVVVSRHARALLDRLRASGIEVVDLFEVFRLAKQEPGPAGRDKLYLAQDSHWSPRGMELAAGAVARRIGEGRWVEPGTVEYDPRPVAVRRLGDLIRMLQAPELDRIVAPENLTCVQIVRRATGQLYEDADSSRILVLGDSFMRIYERDEPGGAGFLAHLAQKLGQPLAAIINDGGASTLVRQNLTRRPRLLANKRLVIWEFVERDILEGAEGWQIIPLPKTDPTGR